MTPLFRSRLFWLQVATVVCALLGTLATRPYDDAFFFKRIAVNLLEHGTLAWNVEDGPVYGSTSQLFQWLAVPVAALFRDYYQVAMRVLAALSLLSAFACTWYQTHKSDGGVSAAVAFAGPALLYAIPSGMETALVVALIAAGLVLIFDPPGRKLHFAIAPAWCALVYLTRPDATLLLVIPLLVERFRASGKVPVREVFVIAGLLAVFLLGFRWVYGTALPLSFYVKQAAFNPCGAEMLSMTSDAQRLRFSVFLLTGAPLFAVACLRRDRVNLTLLATVALFEAYHLVLTLDIMGMHGRYDAPALPLLAFAAGRALKARPEPSTRLVLGGALGLLAFVIAGAGWFPGAAANDDAVPGELYAIAALGAGLLVFESGARRHRATGVTAFGAAALLLVFVGHSGFPARVPSDTAYLDATIARTTVFRGVDALRQCIGERIRVYHSEVGVTGLKLQGGTVRDLGGLMSREWLFRPADFERACKKERPEAIFLPHRSCRIFHEQVRDSVCLKGYERVVEHSSSPLYVRKDLVERYRGCAL